MFLLIGMGALIVGNGYFKANISTIVGKLYEDNDPAGTRVYHFLYRHQRGRIAGHDGGGLRGETYGFHYGFGLAGIGMLLGLLIFLVGPRELFCRPWLDIREAGLETKWGMKMYQLITVGSVLLLIPDLLCPDSQEHVSNRRGRRCFHFSADDGVADLALCLCGHEPDQGWKGRRCHAPRPHGGAGDLHGDQRDFLGVFRAGRHIIDAVCRPQCGPHDHGMGNARVHDAVLQSLLYRALRFHLHMDVGAVGRHWQEPFDSHEVLPWAFCSWAWASW